MCPSAIPSRRRKISHKLSFETPRMQEAKPPKEAQARANRFTISRVIAA
jgi:hypothetical protein